MTALFFGVAKGFTGLVGISSLMFFSAIKTVEVQMEAVEGAAAGAQLGRQIEEAPELIPVPAE